MSAGTSRARTATASANSNIALIKYWGKTDARLHLPTTSSLSLTLDETWTTTTVSFDGGDGGEDSVTINGVRAQGTARERVHRFLSLVRERAGLDEGAAASVTSTSTVPLAAGLASSAAGFAALAGAASRAAGLDLGARDLSRLARRGSGSASRSVFGGLVRWNRGTDDATSYAEPVPCALDLAMVVVALETGAKAVSSTVAMRRTMETSALYPAWVEASATDLDEVLAAAAAGDLERLGTVAEANALGMHATMVAARPAVLYWRPGTVAVLHEVARLREAGLPVWATMDAGPNVKVLTDTAHAGAAASALDGVLPGASVTVRRGGEGIRYEQPGS
ncbi:MULTISPECIES: diphosphomevalonate decarboxylase [unclassified Actinomyces]|uniref:diphosphomevalonate decarboxylase n=1 Tax=unclassified Actinomyces TaxID=2609248 RepID=UPI0020181FD6|nr:MULTISPECIES: diphosphomevalonate decarboxylase [unclassified Actinomyces]MCL3778578.1 diphosphomevalonate decarboxylase [Actinomyces sp. AC-20-1]MCL3789603.1 diphosphomevalonate decarboxylase [Actinomyces sp. 187325]MCL3792236.1 diphosphomevalonate decarboxylase [Actinomyces sp. 186855]MCL3794534.1 diphosphomevalonate decarboxylase [Actinomyces sp. 217892]